MSDNLINLTKQVKITLEKRAAPVIVAQVGVAFDISGSTEHFYKSFSNEPSYIQLLINRFFAIAVTFDDNDALNTWVFDNNHSQTPDIIKSNYENYVVNFILNNRKISKWGSTNFHGVITAINLYYNETVVDKKSLLGKVTSLFKKSNKAQAEKTLTDPAYIIFITDGESDNNTLAEVAVKATSNDRIFWQFAGIDQSGNRYEFLKRLAQTYPNVHYELISPTDTSDAELYDKLISSKFVDWYSNLPK